MAALAAAGSVAVSSLASCALTASPPPERAGSAEGQSVGAAGGPEAPHTEVAVAAEVTAGAGFAWTPRFRGVETVELAREEPRPLRMVAVRIDLREPGVELVATPGNGEAEGETEGMRTSTFLGRHGLQAAVNAAPFAPVHHLEGKPQDVSGLHVSGGERVSPPNRYPALLVTADNRATIAAPPFPEAGVETAVAGFGIVLDDGEAVGGESPLHPRTAAGLSRDGRFLYLLVVDGRQPGTSEGATTAEVGSLLRELGAWDGINLDGGGTSTLVVAGPDGSPVILNRPIHGGVPGFERVAGSHLGVRAPAREVGNE